MEQNRKNCSPAGTIMNENQDTVQKILVTGNGFDLYHGLKANYTDFVKCVEEAFAAPREKRSAFQVKLTELCNVNGFFRHFHFTLSDDPTWTYFEGEMDKILAALIHFQEVVEENQKDPEYDLISYNIIGGLFSYNDLQIFKHFARIFEQIYDDPAGGLFKLRQQYITPEKVLDVRAMVNEVRRELKSFTKALKCYLLEYVMYFHSVAEKMDCREQSEIMTVEDLDAIAAGRSIAMKRELPIDGWRSEQVYELHPDYVINFNYTDTATVYYGIPEESVFYAKGRVGLERGKIVLGAPDLSEEHMEWAYLRNYFQKLMCMVGLPKKEALYPMDEAGEKIPVQVTFFGYSFPDEDQELVEELVQAAQKVVIYYVDQEDYARKMIRILKMFGKKCVTEGVYAGRISFALLEEPLSVITIL